jgi:hypothetical protein
VGDEKTQFITDRSQFPVYQKVVNTFAVEVTIELLQYITFDRYKTRYYMNKDIQSYNNKQSASDKAICKVLATEINAHLPKAENKIWHSHPVWFIDGNPVVGYSKLKNCVRLLFWSGQSFDDPGLHPEGSFKAAEVRSEHQSAEAVAEESRKNSVGL